MLGESGSGKTSLIGTFQNRNMDEYVGNGLSPGTTKIIKHSGIFNGEEETKQRCVIYDTIGSGIEGEDDDKILDEMINYFEENRVYVNMFVLVFNSTDMRTK